ncbi:MAG: hypothetical protein IT204_18685 [Fimbriimonadaceae bacterium]|nr:hypothetical protein [Fimbriimonadaceae bacterium]
MSGRRWARLWLLVLGGHLLPLWAVRLPARRVAAAAATTRVRFQPGAPAAGEAVGWPATAPATRTVTVQHRRLVHQPAAPEADAVPLAQPAATDPVPRLTVAPPPPDRRPAADDALLLALSGTRLGAAAAAPLTLPTAPGRAVRLLVLLPGEAIPDRATVPPPLVLAAAAPGRPTGGGYDWQRLPPDDALLAGAELQEWVVWLDEALWRGRSPDGAVLWLPLAVRAGWEARTPAALTLWQRLGRLRWLQVPEKESTP